MLRTGWGPKKAEVRPVGLTQRPQVTTGSGESGPQIPGYSSFQEAEPNSPPLSVGWTQ